MATEPDKYGNFFFGAGTGAGAEFRYANARTKQAFYVSGDFGAGATIIIEALIPGTATWVILTGASWTAAGVKILDILPGMVIRGNVTALSGTNPGGLSINFGTAD